MRSQLSFEPTLLLDLRLEAGYTFAPSGGYLSCNCDCNMSNLIYIDLMLDFILTTHSYLDIQIT